MTLRGLGRPWQLVAALAIGAALSLVPRWEQVARADDDRGAAAGEFRDGTAAFSRGDYRAAALAFEAAYRHRPHGAAAYNAGLAWEAAGDQARAADAYDRALTRGGLEPRESADAGKRLAPLEKSLGRIDVSGPSGAHISLAQAEQAELPTRVHVRPGSYDLRIEFAGGQVETRPVAVAAGAVLAVVLDEPKPSPPVSTRAPAPLPPPKPVQRADTRGHSSPIAPIAVGTLAAAALATGAAIGLGVAALGARDDYVASNYTDVDAYHRAGALRTWTNIAWASAAVLGVSGAVLGAAALSSRRRSARRGPLTLVARF